MSTVCNWEGECIHIERTNQIHWIMPILETRLYVLSIEIFSLGISYKLVDFSLISSIFCGYICQYTFFYSSRMYLILQGHINKALQRWYWMTELPKYGRVQIDSYIKRLWLKPRRRKIYKVWTKLDRTVEFFANHMYLIMGNYLMKSFFVTLWKKMWLMGIHPTFLHNFGDSSIKDWYMVTLVI